MNKILRKMYEPRRGEIINFRGRMHDEEFYNL